MDIYEALYIIRPCGGCDAIRSHWGAHPRCAVLVEHR